MPVRKPSRCQPDRFDRRTAAGGEPAGRSAGKPGLRLTPDFALPFVQLARLDRPTGWQLLLAPCGQSTALAGLALHRGPNLWHLVLFLIGAIAMRGAGCTYNDILDRKLDARRRAHAQSPVAVGAGDDPRRRRRFSSLRRWSASRCFLCFNRFSIWLGVASLGIVAIYPADEARHFLAAGGARPRLLMGRADGLERDLREPGAGADPALRVRLRLDDRLRHDLCVAGRARRRDCRHPLDRPPVRLARPARRRRVLCRDRCADLAAIEAAGGGPIALSAGSLTRRILLGRCRKSTARTLRRRQGSFAPIATQDLFCLQESRFRGGWGRRCPEGRRVRWASAGARKMDANLLDLIPVRRGHFRYESGYHGEIWLDLDRLFLNPVRIAPLAHDLASRLRAERDRSGRRAARGRRVTRANDRCRAWGGIRLHRASAIFFGQHALSRGLSSAGDGRPADEGQARRDCRRCHQRWALRSAEPMTPSPRRAEAGSRRCPARSRQRRATFPEVDRHDP